MKYYVYCDGAYSTERGVGAWSFLIFTDVRYIYWNSNKSRFITTPTYAEDVAMGMACHYLATHAVVNENDVVMIFSDSLSTIQLMNNLLTRNKEFKFNDQLVADSINNIKELNELCHVEFVKVHSHRAKLNPNICVDRMAKYYLRS